MLTILESNRLEVLARELGHSLNQSRQAPLEPRIVVVPNPAMGRWLWISLAAQRGISANLDCVLPGSFVWRVFQRVLDDVGESSPYDPQVMLWRLHELLRQGVGDDALAAMGPWRDTEDDRHRFELAGALARQFDQYIVYRPDLLRRWRRGHNEAGVEWQAELWRRLASATAAPDWSVLRGQLEQIDASRVRAVLPAQVSVFGIPLLSPGYLDVLGWLGRHIDVVLYLPNPCREHWAQIVPERDLGRRAGVADERALYLETGNALLASWGGQVRELIDLIHEQDALDAHERFEDPGADSLLHAIQQQVLQLHEPAREGEPRVPVAGDDRSVQVHICHSARREVEVLHDQLLGLLDTDPELSASDIVVMAPDIEEHAPHIDAIFSGGPLPYRISDRDPRRGAVVIDAFLSLLDLRRERFEADDVLTVLETDPARRRFGLALADSARIREWVRETGVRRDLGNEQGTAPAGSWRNGLDRMLLGFALPGEREGVFSEVSPYDEIEGTDATVLGALAEYLDRLGALATGMKQERTARAWSLWLGQQLERFFVADDDDEQDFQTLRTSFSELATHAGRAGFEQRVGFAIVRDWLDAALATQPGGPFLGHGITFASLVAMRNVPARVVCLLGLDDGKFPRPRQRASFDLIAAAPRRGDRSRRDDDRLAFLESLLNARGVLYLSYVGRDVRDDNPSPPAVVVSELTEYCRRNFVKEGDGDDVLQQIVVSHPLHPFSRRYFDASDQRLFSYSAERCDAAAAVASGEPAVFLDQPLPAAAPETVIELQTLQSFYKNPSQFVLREKLQLTYHDDAEPLDTTDPQRPVALERWKLHDRVLQLLDSGHDAESALAIVERSRFAAPGPLGRMIMRGEIEEMVEFRSGLRAQQPHEPLVALPVTVAAGRHLLSATLKPLDEGLFFWRHGKTRAQDRLHAWLAHLVLCLAAPEGIAKTTSWYAENDAFVLQPVADAAVLLADLIEIYLQAQRVPLPFFPNAAWEFCEALEKFDDDQRARAAAEKYYRECSIRNDYVRRAFGAEQDGASIGDWAMRILGPLRQHLVTVT